MKTRALDSNKDWTFGTGKQSFVSNIDALMQNLSTRLKQWKGNCFFDTTAGVDWNNLLDIGTKTLLELDIKRIILQTGGVLKITSFASTINPESRNVVVTAYISTIFGDATFSEVV